MDNEFEDGLRRIQLWIDQLIECIEAIKYKQDHRKISFDIHIYTLIYNLADKYRFEKELYHYYIENIKDYTRRVYDQELSKLQGIQLLDCLIKDFEYHKMLVYGMRKIFMYLDRYHVERNRLPTLLQAGLNIFKYEIMDKIKVKARHAIIEQINRERNRDEIDRRRISEAVICFTQIGLTDAEIMKLNYGNVDKLVWKGTENLDYYKENLEKASIEDTKLYYERKSADSLASYSFRNYLEEAKQALEEEMERADKCLNQSTKVTLYNVLCTIFLDNVEILAEMENTGFMEMLIHDKLDNLKLIFNIFRQYEPVLNDIACKMTTYIESKGTLIVNDQYKQQDPLEYTKALLILKNEIDNLIVYSFESHSQLKKVRDRAFQNFMNECKFSAPYIAYYCDNEMRKGLKGINDIDIEQKLDSIIGLILCLNDRDVFIRSYTRYLANRLLDGSSVSDEAEKSMIIKFKVEFGHNIVNKISNMYQDIALSKALMNEFRSLGHRGNNEIAMYVNMLKSGCWPCIYNEPILIPGELLDCTKSFESFYFNKFKGCHVTWLFGYGSCELETKFASRAYKLAVNPYQATILLLFNHSDILTLKQIKAATRLSSNTLKTQLITFFNPRMRLLIKTSRGKVIEDEEPISVNGAFEFRGVRVNYIPKKVTKSEADTKEYDQAIASERKNILDTVIVRIMKGRKKYGHPELVQEVMRQVTQFTPQLHMIKTQIESLIQREFLARDENDRSVYIYIP